MWEEVWEEKYRRHMVLECKIVSSIGWTAVKKCSVLCCKDIDAWTTSNDMLA